MPVTWCYQLEDERQYCSTGFPMGCFSRESRSQVDSCSINVNLNQYYLCIKRKSKKKNNYYNKSFIEDLKNIYYILNFKHIH